jgi:hypothetical protein
MYVDVKDAPYMVVPQVVVFIASCFLLRGVFQLDRPLHQCLRFSTRSDFKFHRDAHSVMKIVEVARFRSRPFANDQE